MKLEYEHHGVKWSGFLPDTPITALGHPGYRISWDIEERVWRGRYDGQILCVNNNADFVAQMCTMHLLGRKELSSAPAIPESEAVVARDEKIASLREQLVSLEEAELDSRHTLTAWFDTQELARDAIDPTVLDAAKGFLRTCRVGGMDPDESDLVITYIEMMSQQNLFADLFLRTRIEDIELLKQRNIEKENESVEGKV